MDGRPRIMKNKISKRNLVKHHFHLSQRLRESSLISPLIVLEYCHFLPESSIIIIFFFIILEDESDVPIDFFYSEFYLSLSLGWLPVIHLSIYFRKKLKGKRQNGDFKFSSKLRPLVSINQIRNCFLYSCWHQRMHVYNIFNSFTHKHLIKIIKHLLKYNFIN